MKQITILILVILITKNSFAQGINFQGVARSANGTIIAGSNISLRLSILSKSVDATPEFIETKTVVTNTQGIFSIVVGDATNVAVIGSFKTINWANAPKFLKVEMDPSGGTNYLSMGITQLQYVPYSFYSLGVDASNVSGTLSVAKGGTGVTSLDSLKVALKITTIDTTSLSNRINSKFTKTDILPVENGGTGVNDLSKLKAALKLDTTSLSLPTVTSTNASSITSFGATIFGNITNDGGSTILRQGICFDTIPIPNTSVSQVMFIDPANSGTNLLTGVFDASISSYCTSNTRYYYRTFAVNKNGTAYSDVRTFITLSSITFLTNPSVTVDRNALTFNISVKANGDTLKSISFHFKENGISLTGDVLDKVVTVTNAFNDTVINYFYPKYISTNKNYICEISLTSNRGSVRKEIAVSTSALDLPTVKALSVGLVYLPQFSSTSYRFSYNVLSKGGGNNITSGITWTTSSSTNPNISITPSASNSTNPSSPEINLTTDLISLSPGVLYYLTPYVTNSVGTSYGNTITLTTPALIPSLGTIYQSSYSNNSAILFAQIINDGGLSITASGVVWSTTSQTPTVSLTTKTTTNIGSGNFSNTITGLSPGTSYYVRAYATNSLGTAYGSTNTFITLANVPILSGTLTPTVTVGDNGIVTALTGGTISSTNGSNIIERGILYSEYGSSFTYTTAEHITSNLDNNLSFQCLITIFRPGTTYYIRSYAKNSDGIGYGPIVQVVIPYPPAPPFIGNVNYANLLSTSVVLSSNTYTSDYTQLTDKGFIWSTSSSNISVSLNTKQSLGIDKGTFSGTISNLTPNTTYYIKAYATNASGSSYSTAIQVTTPN